ncbi:hypothetical protein DOY81_013519, partial [Sarcophaga bullata]
MGVVCILLSAYELILVAGALPFPSISMHILMLKAVCKSFLNIFLLYSIFIVTFTVCFYIKGTEVTAQKSNHTEGNSKVFLQQKANNTEEENDHDEDDANEEEFKNFSKLWPALVKTIVMFIGELDANSITIIELLINNYYNKAAINYATDSRDPAILKTLLSTPSVQVNYVHASLTPLNSLAKNLTTDNFDECFECMKILLAHDALINKPDQQELTPLHNIVKNRNITDAQKYRLVQMFIKLPNIDIDTYREGELRRTLETLYPLMELPEKSQCAKITFHTLLKYIREDNMKTFVEQYNDETRYTSREEDLELLVVSIERGAHEAFDLLMEKGVDYNRIVRHNNTPVQIAWIFGNWYALEKLLKQPDIVIRSKDQPLSHIVCKLSEGYRQNFCDYWKCFIVLLDSDKIDINGTDYSKSTALHYAVQYHNNRAVRELLKRGAGICMENVFHELPFAWHDDSAGSDVEAFHVFSNPLMAFAKILVMFTGEFDAGSMQLDTNYMLFLFFVFFMTIILFNLLNGLAVSDTQAIKNQAELNEIICRINLLSRYEKTVFKQTGCSSFVTKRQPFRFMCYVFKKLFPTYTTDVKISIRPNDKNRIKTSKIEFKEK